MNATFPPSLYSSRARDVGCGTGEIAQAVNKIRPELKITGVDVYVRPKTFIPVKEYDGCSLPFETNAFDAVTIIDVLHHCEDPVAVLKECARVSNKWVLIKDHISNSVYDETLLKFMDWVGNRAHGVDLPYNYFSSRDWKSAIRIAGLKLIKDRTQLNLYPKPFDYIFGGGLHCVYLLQK